MEREPHQPERDEQRQGVNSYGTDNPEKQAEIERARADASRQRRQDRTRLERYVEAGLDPDDAEALIEFEHFVREPQAEANAERHAARAAFEELVGDDQEALAKFDELYVGTYDSPEAWARAVGEDLDWEAQLDRVVDPMLRPYVRIDYAKFAQEQRYAWDVMQGSDGKTHVFMR
ncbi:antirestriction protein ArdA [Micromonospora sp. Llam7]|uniref:antirestriction protein ArdA n=1 Tax=Micromonospora tarapacensis TaxID=2835305 RepID=UPI001C83CD01|nr:antirestriction protein ArdA [Micromonospora tarapacensis]MBX7268793.1 antirestriction protein ArdA [Micromonospora tarapacensis]